MRYVVVLIYALQILVSSKIPCVFSLLYSNEIAVRILDGEEKAREVAERHNYTLVGKIGSLDDLYLFKHPRLRKRSISVVGSHVNLENDPNVLWSEQQLIKMRTKRDFGPSPDGHEVSQFPGWLINSSDLQWIDPLYAQQWYLHHGGRGGFDMNVKAAWARGYSGKGVSVSILDDGLQWRHPDLMQNYDKFASLDINGHGQDPTPVDDGNNKHGTRCAGEVAAVAGNNICGVGIAFNSRIGGVRMLDGDVYDGVEASALSLNPQHVDIYSASWGPEDDGETVDGPGPLARLAFENGIRYGRGGLGSIYVWASGNGGKRDDSCSCDGYANSLYTISVSSAAQDGSRPWYLEQCPSTLTTTYSSGNSWQPAVITTDLNTPGNLNRACTTQHTGTSASAPLAAAIIALALEANPKLSWRDVQHLIILSSNPEPLLDDWIINSLNRKVSNNFGYGLLDADRLVQRAKSWQNVPEQHVCRSVTFSPAQFAVENRISVGTVTDGCASFRQDQVAHVEHVQAVLTIQSARRGNLYITLTSPRNTTSVLLPRRSLDNSRKGFSEWAFTSVQFWGEDPVGEWRLVISDQKTFGRPARSAGLPSANSQAVLMRWSLVLYGTNTTSVDVGSGIYERTSTKARGEKINYAKNDGCAKRISNLLSVIIFVTFMMLRLNFVDV